MTSAGGRGSGMQQAAVIISQSSSIKNLKQNKNKNKTGQFKNLLAKFIRKLPKTKKKKKEKKINKK